MKLKIIGSIVFVVLAITLGWMLVKINPPPTVDLEEAVAYMEKLSKNKFAGRDCNYDENFDQYKKFNLTDGDLMECLTNAKPTIKAAGMESGEPRIHVRYECSFQGHIGYRDMYKDFESDSCSLGWRE